MKIGDKVGYKSALSDTEYQHVGKIYDIWEGGIPSCPQPMVKIEGKAGCVLRSHCTVLEEAKPLSGRRFMIRSNEHSAWWNPDRRGYTYTIEKAGLYTEEEADAICKKANQYLPAGERNEVKVSAPEVVVA